MWDWICVITLLTGFGETGLCVLKKITDSLFTEGQTSLVAQPVSSVGRAASYISISQVSVRQLSYPCFSYLTALASHLAHSNETTSTGNTTTGVPAADLFKDHSSKNTSSSVVPDFSLPGCGGADVEPELSTGGAIQLSTWTQLIRSSSNLDVF